MAKVDLTANLEIKFLVAYTLSLLQRYQNGLFGTTKPAD